VQQNIKGMPKISAEATNLNDNKTITSQIQSILSSADVNDISNSQIVDKTKERSKGTGSNVDPEKKPIKIGFDAKRAFYNRSGLGNYSRNLINSIVKFEKYASITLFTPKTKNRILLDPLAEKVSTIVSPSKFFHKKLGSLWRSRFIVKDIKHNKIDIYHGMSHELPYGIQKSGAKSIVTIHDLIFLRFPKFYGPINVFIYKKKMQYACRVADKIVAISSQTKEDLVNFLNVDSKKIEVIYQSCNVVYQQKRTIEESQKVRAKYGLPDKYLLYVGTIEERKNLLSIIKALKENEINIPLVVIGRKADYFHKTVNPYLVENKIESIIFPEKVTNDELPVIYQNALCFVYPSIFEGFGIPILEAIVSGIPVITSKGSCFEETGGPGSIYVDPYNPTEIGEAIQKVSENQELRSAMVNMGIEHAKQFTPEQIASDYMNLYKNLLKS
jgi:glycosyltransferase involved in cell wall biosynthesis